MEKEDFPSDSVVKNLLATARDARWIPGSGRSPGEGNGSILAWENPMDRRAWRATVLRVTEELDMTYQLNNNTLSSIM